MRTVHPGGRGEREPVEADDSAEAGSSPRARGREEPPIRLLGQHRFIPAGAGNGLAWRVLVGRNPVHPRGRGERATVSDTMRSAPGSSPRARGTVHPDRKAGPLRRFIPAGAGNGHFHKFDPVFHPVHPRGRGERYGSAPVWAGLDGSSPRARGTAHRPLDHVGDFRFIPAGAGNGTPSSARTLASTVHPRGRGER